MVQVGTQSAKHSICSPSDLQRLGTMRNKWQDDKRIKWDSLLQEPGPAMNCRHYQGSINSSWKHSLTWLFPNTTNSRQRTEIWRWRIILIKKIASEFCSVEGLPLRDPEGLPVPFFVLGPWHIHAARPASFPFTAPPRKAAKGECCRSALDFQKLQPPKKSLQVCQSLFLTSLLPPSIRADHASRMLRDWVH